MIACTRISAARTRVTSHPSLLYHGGHCELSSPVCVGWVRTALRRENCTKTPYFQHQELESAKDFLQKQGDHSVAKCFHDVITKRRYVPSLSVLRAMSRVWHDDTSVTSQLYHPGLGDSATRDGEQRLKRATILKILKHKLNIAWKRHVYLESIKKYREQGYNIVYTDEAWFKFPSNDKHSFHRNMSFQRNDRTMVIHAGGAMGFLPGALMLNTLSNPSNIRSRTCKTKSGVNTTVFSTYINQHLLPNIPRNCVVVMDNASFHHGNKTNRKSNKSRESSESVDTLDHQCCHSYNLECRTGQSSTQSASPLIHTHLEGCIYLRLPPYHTFLSPIEMAWKDLRLLLSHDKRCVSGLSSEEFESLIKMHLQLIDAERWAFYLTKTTARERLLRDADLY